MDFIFGVIAIILAIIFRNSLLGEISAIKKRVSFLERGIKIPDNRPQEIPQKADFGFEKSLSTEQLLKDDRNTANIAVGDAPRGNDFEINIGKKLLPALGVIAIFLGVSFFLKFAFENNLIGVTGRVVLGLFAGLGFVIAGEVLNAKLEKYSWILSGCGVGILYLSIFSSFSYYSLIGVIPAFAFMFLVTCFSALLSIRYSALPLAIIGILGGFITPVLISSGVDNAVGLFSYIALINLGVLVISMFRNWRVLNLIGILGTIFIFLGWFSKYYNPGTNELFIAELFLTLFLIEYLASTISGNLFSADDSTGNDLALLTINAFWYFGMSYYLLEPDFKVYLGLFTAVMAILYTALAYFSITMKSGDKKLSSFLGAISLVFLTLVFPVQLSGKWITVAWAMEALVLCSLGFTLLESRIRSASLVVLLIALIRLFSFDLNIDINNFTLFYNSRFFIFAILIFSSGAMSYLFYSNGKELSEKAGEKSILTILATLFNVLVLIAISLEISSYFAVQTFTAKMLPSLGEYDYLSYASITNQKNTVLTIFWSLYATALLIIGMYFDNKKIRTGSLALYGVSIVTVFFLILPAMSSLSRIIAVTVLGALLLEGSYLYYKKNPNI